MKIKIYLGLFLIYNFYVSEIQSLDVHDNSDELELYKHVFAKLNAILEGNNVTHTELNRLKGRIQQLENQLKQTGFTSPNSSNNNFSENPLSCQVNSVLLDPSTHNPDNYCFGDNWLVIQRRIDGSENFYRDWNDYKQGFGNKSNEFFLGLEYIHQVTSAQPYELLIVMEDFDNSKRYAKYDRFEIGNEQEQYVLKLLGDYSGNAGDSLSYHKGAKFSTKGTDNDEHPKFNCAEKFQSAWWFKACHESNLNGCYNDANLRDSKSAVACGIHWKTFRGQWYSLKHVEIMIRPKV
ncbi:microfibril-associated glycoprotein 4-like [Cochliomyia hominivorax]